MTLSHCCLTDSRCGQPTLFKNADDVFRYLDGLGLFHMNLGLDRMNRALEALTGFFSDLHRPACPVVQIVGTNGKGSTGAFLQSLGMAHGLRVGLYTSPHFLSPTERIRMGTKVLPEAAWPELAGRACAAADDLTYFELLTIMAVLAFRQADPDLLIFEAGLGGRYDATTALPADLVCFTPFGLDHLEVLGPDLRTIAADKADAMRAGMFAAVSAPQEHDAERILHSKAQAMGLPLCFTDLPNTIPASLLPEGMRSLCPLAADAKLGLQGPHQRVNAASALTVWLLLCHRHGWHTDERVIRRGLADAFLPGRLQTVYPTGKTPFLLDGAHNVHGMTALHAALTEMKARDGIRPSAVIFSCLADKSPEDMAPLVASLAGDAPILLPTLHDNPRAASGRTLQTLFPSGKAKAVDNLEQALQEVQHEAEGDDPVLICGSLYLLAEFFSLFPAALQG